MATLSMASTGWHLSRAVPADFYEPLWYAAYTRAHHERRVAEQLALRSLAHFLPLYQAVRQWKDRKMKLQLPLFPGYVFVRIALRDRLQLLQVPGIARLVGFGSWPTPLPQEEMDTLRTSLVGGLLAEPHPYLTAGRRVRIKAGPLAGMQGILVRKKKQQRFVISLELILRSVSVEVEGVALEPVESE